MIFDTKQTFSTQILLCPFQALISIWHDLHCFHTGLRLLWSRWLYQVSVKVETLNYLLCRKIKINFTLHCQVLLPSARLLVSVSLNLSLISSCVATSIFVSVKVSVLFLGKNNDVIFVFWIWNFFKNVLQCRSIIWILYEYCINIVQILYKYCANIVQISLV